MLALYLGLLWLILTAAISGSKSLRSSGVVFVVWFGVTAVSLWPVTRRVVESGVYQTISQEVGRQLGEELRAEFPGMYEEVDQGNQEVESDGQHD